MSRDRWAGALVVLLGLAWSTTALATKLETPDQLLSRYLELIVAGEIASADSLWLPEDRRHAHRLGVHFRDVSLKQDLDSVLWRWIEPVRDGRLRVGVETVFVERDRAECALSFLDPPVRARSVLALERVGPLWFLASRLRHLTDGWQEERGRWVRLLHPPHRELDPRVLTEWDRRCGEILAVLGADEVTRDRVRTGKVDVVLADEVEIVRLVGQPTEGWTHLGFDTVVTQWQSHPHELVHVLVNVVAGDLPLYTLPLLQEGIATHLGGRWGRAPKVLEMVGAWALASGTVSLESLLDRGGFASVGADLAYPVAGLFCGFLLERLGPERFLEVYRAAGGSDAELSALTRGEIERRLASAAGLEWTQLRQEFAAWWPSRRDAGLRPGALAPEVAGRASRRLRGEGGLLGIHVREDRLVLEWTAESPSQEAQVRIALFSEDPVTETGRLHLEQLGKVALGARAAVVLGPDEAGLYDFVADQVVAKWVRAFAPGGEGAPTGHGRLVYEIDLDATRLDLMALRWDLVPERSGTR